MVFINCPFDDEYLPILKGIAFAVYRCGFIPRTVLQEDNALIPRLAKIERFIEGCRYGIHDISRIELNVSGLPRFNMPFELGLFFGAMRFGNKMQKSKNALVLERKKYSYQQTISDLNGIDTRAHNDNPEDAMIAVRNWLRTASKRNVPAPKELVQDYRNFQARLPDVRNHIGPVSFPLPFVDYCAIVEDALGVLYAQNGG